MVLVTNEEAEEVPENSYLALRAAKIARNQARLKELGLWKPPMQISPVPPGDEKSKLKKAKRSKVNEKPSLKSPVNLRRSRRLSDKPEQPTTSQEDTTTAEQVVKKSPLIGQQRNTKKRSRAAYAPSLPSQPAGNSVRSIDLDTELLVVGEEKAVLGRSMERTGKEFVIYQSFALAASTKDLERLGGSRLSFNKYCGVQEWKNAIFLWVNLGNNKDNPVVNDFLEDGRQITWFGGSRMYDDSPVIHRLIQLGKEGEGGERNESSRVILWCRKYQTATKQFTPYVCFGRLAYQSHVRESHPLAFVWRLLDYDRFKNHTDPNIRARFQEFTS
eukprot:scaffold627_cov125-Cylindrotheca_fusiformis.AAC.31